MEGAEGMSGVVKKPIEVALTVPPAELQVKPDPQSRLETGLRGFNGTLKRLQTLVTTGLQKKEGSVPAQEPPTEPEKKELEKPLTPAEIKAKIDSLSEVIQGLDSSFETSIKSVTDEILPILKQIDPSSEQDVGRLNELLEAATAKIQAARAAREQEVVLRTEFGQLKEDHERALLAEANAGLGSNFESFDQLLNAWTQRKNEAYSLGRRRFWTGKFFNRERIIELKKEGQVISAFFNQKSKVYYTNAYRTTTTYYDPDRTLEEVTVKITKPIVEKMLTKYDELTEELRGQESASAEPDIPETLRDSLDTDFIEKYFIPYLNKAKEGFAGWSEKSVAELTDPKNIQEAIDIVKASLKIQHDNAFSPLTTILSPEDEAKNKQLHDRMARFPDSVKDTIAYFFGYPIFTWRPTEEYYKKIAKIVQVTQGVERQAAIVSTGKDFLDRLETILRGDDMPYSLHAILWDLTSRRYSLPDPEAKIEPLINNFLNSIDNKVWLCFMNNPEAQRIFGTEQLENAQQYLVSSMVERIMTLKPYSEEAKKSGYRLLDFKSPDTIPIIILNAYRDTRSFMYHVPNSEQTVFYQFIAGLTEQEVDQLGQQNIPGLIQLIELVKSNPNSQWLDSSVWDKESNTSRPDPVSREIGSKLVEMSLHLLDKGDKNMEEFVTGFFDNYSLNTVLEAFSQIQKERGELPMYFSSALMRRLRRSDPLLREQYQTTDTSSYDYFTGRREKRDPIPEESYKLFNQSMDRLLKEANNPESTIYEYREHFSNEHILRFIARQPERIKEALNLPLSTTYLFSVLLKEGGPLYTNRDKIMENIFANGNALKRAKEIETIFSKKVPYWKQLYLFTDARIGEQLATATSEYPITEVVGIPLRNIVERHKAEKQINYEGLTRLQAMVKNPEVIKKLESGELDYVPFTELNGVYKRLVFRDLLKRSIETSRNEEQKTRADQRNRILSSEGFSILDGTYIHGSSVDVIESVLLNGNLPQEALGEGARTDSYPFQTDFSCLTQEFISSQPNIEEVFNKSISGNYGSSRTLGRDGQIFYMYRRTSDTYEGGKRYGPSDRHTLILGGMPATEISGITLRNADATLETVKKAILENGFYIPVYDLNGSLLFTPEDFDSLRTELNYIMPVEVWDYSLKTGDQLGSNPGGEFTVPTEQGPIKYYVKFATPESTDQIWNEELADSIYRHLGIAVPDTKIVKIDTTYGHSSQILPHDQAVRTDDLRNGFIADALLANWDVVANSGNVISSGGRLIRIDNGGSLLFRARGERKTAFGGVVTELESMRTSYPGLTQEDIQSQLGVLRERFTDEAINQLVDSVRLNSQDRESLKNTLRQRRDYILSYYSTKQEAPETKEITDEGKRVNSSLRAETFDDATISAVVPEWQRLTGEEGYQHNGVLLGDHLKNAVSTLKYLPEYWSLSEIEKGLALVATLFHDIGKPTGRRDAEVPRDFEHEIPSAQIAAEYMRKWGYSEADARTVIQVIINDGIVSDIARGKVRDERKNLTPQQLRSALNNNPSVLKILRAVNRADVIATVGAEGFNAIADVYNRYFDEAKI